jgi:Tfp pilus assembly protein PilF
MLPSAILVAVVVAYAPSLGGSWVWDDHSRVASNELYDTPRLLLVGDVFGATGAARTDVYRPLPVLTQWIVHSVHPGPLSHRIASLLLHLASVLVVAFAARQLGASRELSWFGAALFGLHPGSSEAVAWISGRDDLLGGLLFVSAWAAFHAGRPAWSGLLLTMAVFCKESYLLVAGVALVWMLGKGRLHVWALLPPMIGAVGYVAVRHAIALPIPWGAAEAEPVAALGGLTLRGVSLALVPSGADALSPYRPNPWLGWAMILAGIGMLGMCWRRPIVASVTATGVFLAPAALAAANNGVVGDRYFYAVFAVVCGSLAAAGGARRWHRMAWTIPAILAVLTFVRSGDWTNDRTLFASSLARHPDNPHAAFHVAHDLHTREGDCAAAIPLYEQAVDVEPRAINNLQACLLTTGSFAAAAELGPRAAASAPLNPNPAANTARAYFAMGQLEEAQDWAQQAIDKDPRRARNWVLLGNILGRRGRIDAAADAFREALALSPGDPDALLGLEQTRTAGGE